MQTILHISRSSIQEILSQINVLLSFSKLIAKETIENILKRYENIDALLRDELSELISEAVYTTNPLYHSTSEKGILSTEHRRKAYFK